MFFVANDDEQIGKKDSGHGESTVVTEDVFAGTINLIVLP